jgi:hypothetical protein
MSEEQKTFSEVVKPVMEWLAKNKHPHTKIIIESNRAEMVEGAEIVMTGDLKNAVTDGQRQTGHFYRSVEWY